jgi:hypothetical protein
MRSLLLSGRVLVWYAPRYELVQELHSYIYLAGILTCKGDIRRGRRPPFSAYPSG